MRLALARTRLCACDNAGVRLTAISGAADRSAFCQGLRRQVFRPVCDYLPETTGTPPPARPGGLLFATKDTFTFVHAMTRELWLR